MRINKYLSVFLTLTVLMSMFSVVTIVVSALSVIPDNDYVINDDFDSGVISDLWRTFSWEGYVGIVDNPDGNGKVLFLGAMNGVTELYSAEDTLKDYTLEFKIRINTSYPVVPQQDGVHYPLWRAQLSKNDTMQLDLADNYVWNSCDLGGTAVTRFLPLNQWKTIKIISYHNHYKLYYEGNLIVETDSPDQIPGSVGFFSMHMDTWIDDVKITLHPEAYIYDTFGDGITSAWANTTGWDITSGSNNNSLHVNAGTGISALIKTNTGDNYDDYTLSFKAKQIPNESGGGWKVALHGSTDTTFYGFHFDSNGNISLGLQNGDSWDTSNGTGTTVSMSPMPSDNEWHQYHIIVDRNRYVVYIDNILIVDFTSSYGDIISGFAGFQSIKNNMYLDDITISPLATPIYSMQPIHMAYAYTVSDTKGFLLDLFNDDFVPHEYTAEYTLTDQSGNTLYTNTYITTLTAGESIVDEQLIIPFSNIGEYKTKVTLKCDGRTFLSNQENQFTVIADLPELSPVYESKFGTVFDFYNEDAVNILYKSGIRTLRGEELFKSVQGSSGNYDFTFTDNVVAMQKKFHGMESMNLYLANLKGMRTLSELHEYSSKMGAVATRYSNDLKYYEVWNEPNHGGFWQPPHPGEYAALLKEAYNTIKAGDPDADVGGMSTSGVDIEFMREVFKNGAAYYMDTITYHPYGYPEAPESIMPAAVKAVKTVIEEFGGWMDHQITEQGYPTSISGSGVTEDVQAKYLVRTWLFAAVEDVVEGLQSYGALDQGTDPTNNEARFGFIRQNYSGTKPAYRAISTMTKALINTDFYGRLHYEPDEYVYIFKNYYGTPVIVAWAQDKTSTISLDVGASIVTKTDMYGNVSNINTPGGIMSLNLTGEPVYITGASISKAILSNANNNYRDDKASFIREKLSEITDTVTRDNLINTFNSIDSAIQSVITDAEPQTRTEEMLSQINNLFSFANDVINAYGNGNITKVQVGNFTEGIYRYADAVTKSLIVMNEINNISQPELTYTNHVNIAESAINSKKGNQGSLVYAEKMLIRAKEYGAKASAINGTQNAMADRYNILAVKLADMAYEMCSKEEILYRKTLFNVINRSVKIVAGKSMDITTTLTNGYDSSFDGRIDFEYPASWNQATTSIYINGIAVGEQWQDSMTIHVPTGTPFNDFLVTAKAYKDGILIDQLDINVSVIIPVDVTIEPLSTSLADVTSITAKVKNIGNDAYSGTVTMKDPAGNTLSSSNNTITNLPQGSTQDVTFSINYEQDAPYNEYSCNVEVKETGTGIISFNKDIPLDFTITSLVSGSIIVDGDLSEWANTFPVHLQFASEAMDTSDLSASAYTMIDNNNLYIAIAAKDDYHVNFNVGSNMWSGDCLQISIDPLNDKSGSYGSDDYEVGFSKNSYLLTDQACIWTGPDTTIIDSSQYIVKRDENTKTTVYEISLPLSRLQGLSPVVDEMFGINFALNEIDNQLALGREGWIQFTSGTTDVKCPAYYKSFTVLTGTLSGDTPIPVPEGLTGKLIRQVWKGLPGTAVSDLTNHSNFPNNPDITETISSFEAPSNVEDNYGQRIYGYIVPSVTGEYTFHVAGDDNTELWLSTDANPDNKVRIAYHNDWTGSREWNKFSTQTSPTIYLTAGQYYYVEALSKEGIGDDNLAVGWKVPGTSNITVIPADNITTNVVTGTLTRQIWSDIMGKTVADLTNNVNYPDNPTFTETVSSFEAATNVADNYGQRIFGFIVPSVTGQYKFYIACDDNGELWLSTNENPANKVKIAYHTDWTDSRQWDKFSTQESPTISLIAGKYYYVEAISKESEGGDNLAVGWIVPGKSEIEIISAENISTITSETTPDPTPTPVSFNMALQGTIIASVTEPKGIGNYDIEIIRDGVKPNVGDTNSSFQYDSFNFDSGPDEQGYGYIFNNYRTFNKVVFQEGMHFIDGGWFKNCSLRVQVRQNGVWHDVSATVEPVYPNSNSQIDFGDSFETYTFTFDDVTGDGIRIFGTVGGTARFVSIAELEVWGYEQVPEPTNLALNKPVTAISEGLPYPASQAVDGNDSTRWEANDWADGDWIVVDLEAVYTLTGTELLFPGDSNVIWKYTVEVSTDNTNWITVADRSGTGVGGGSYVIDSFDTTARYVKVTNTQFTGSYWPGINEIKINGF